MPFPAEGFQPKGPDLVEVRHLLKDGRDLLAVLCPTPFHSLLHASCFHDGQSGALEEDVDRVGLKWCGHGPPDNEGPAAATQPGNRF